MINASKEKLLNFYSENIRYHVPFFQRSYVWGIENWREQLLSIHDAAFYACTNCIRQEQT